MSTCKDPILTVAEVSGKCLGGDCDEYELVSLYGEMYHKRCLCRAIADLMATGNPNIIPI
ncbi:MAG: hypothetical protein R2798_01405 [Chitinophagales bacterium]|nr:hypothetical protein [Bacteroidota bacterium]MCB9042941.1 hypothetical protein [Chitinophagales bacterium]